MGRKDPKITAAACRYLLVGLLPRLEQVQPGLVAELRAGVTADRDAMIANGTLSPEVDATVYEVLRMLSMVDA